jgi:thioredoxin reductase (NADPH)
VQYINAYGTLVDGTTVQCTNPKEKKSVATLTAKVIVLATGCRPTFPMDIPGAIEYGISSDDLFWLKKSPGKTLVVGGSYVALECAGFLRELGLDVTVLVRSILLRGFDQQMAEMVGQHLESIGVRLMKKTHPQKVERTPNGGLTVFWSSDTGQNGSDTFDTVMWAIGRAPIGMC